MKSRLPLFGSLFAALLLAPVLHALEPWADKSLPVQSGLALWLDAGRQRAAFTSAQQPPPDHQKPLATWLDGSCQRSRGFDPLLLV